MKYVNMRALTLHLSVKTTKFILSQIGSDAEEVPDQQCFSSPLYQWFLIPFGSHQYS